MRFGKVSGTRSRLRFTASALCVVALLMTTLAVFPQTIVRAALDQQQQPKTAPTKRPLTHKDYDSWRLIQTWQVSRDGKFIGYAYTAEDGDGEIVVRNVVTGTEWRAPRGYRPPVPPPDDPGTNAAEFQASQARLLRPFFTADSRFVVFGTEPTKAELNKAKKDKKKPEEMPKNGMGIMDLTSGKVVEIERVKNFQVPEDAGGFVAYLMEAPLPEKPGHQHDLFEPGFLRALVAQIRWQLLSPYRSLFRSRSGGRSVPGRHLLRLRIHQRREAGRSLETGLKGVDLASPAAIIPAGGCR